MAQTTKPYGYRSGGLQLVEMKMDSATVAQVEPGDFVVAVTAGYVGQGAAGDTPLGVAYSVGTDPSADGESTVLVNVARDAIYEYPPDTGTVTQALVGTTMDIGGAQSINIDASADDIIIVVGVNTDRNTLFVKLIPTFAGVA
jgi:hypothetical protein